MSVSLGESCVQHMRSVAEVRDWIVAEISRSLDVDASEIDPAAPLDSHGVDSLGAIGITAKLSSWLNVNLSATLMWDCPTIDAVARKLASEEVHQEPFPSAGVIAMQTQGDRTPVFFFPGIGGHPVTFMPLAMRLSPLCPCYGLSVPGLDGEGEPVARVEDMALWMLQNIRMVQKQGPYQLAGYSFGGLLAYEVARQLEQANQSVSLLAIYDAFAPAARTSRPLWQRIPLHVYFLLTRSGRLAYVRQRYRRVRGICDAQREAMTEPPCGGDDAANERIHRIQQLNYQAAACYRPGKYGGGALWFTASERESFNIFYRTDSQGGWADLCAGGVQMVKLPGSHFNLLDSDHAPGAAELLLPFLR